VSPFDLGHVFVRSSAGVFTVLDVPGQGTLNGQGATAQRINAADTIVGYFADSQSVIHGFTRTLDGNFSIFDAPGAIATYTAGINDAGTVVGQFVDNNLAVHGFIRTQDGTFTVFDVPGAANLSVVGINAGGAVTSSFADILFVYHGFLRNPDGTSDIFDAPGVGIGCDPESGTGCIMGTGVADINGSGEIVGTDYATIGPRSFVRTAAGVFNVFTPPGTNGAGSSSAGINDSGAIVGNYTDANNATHGYLRNPDGTITRIDDPNAFQEANSAGTFVTHINATGAIVGYYFDAQGARHGFLRE